MASEPFSAEIILSCLKTSIIGRNIIYRPIVSSTMDIAFDEMLRDAPHGTAIIAELQEHGKGRLSRHWVSPFGGVYVSVILYPPQKLLTSLTMIASLAVTDCIQEVSGIKANIKWPNDVLIEGKKVSGILARSGNTLSRGSYAIVGIGINADLDLTSQPDISAMATTLSTATGTPVSRQAVICSFLENFEKRYIALKSGEPLWKEWRKCLVTLGKRVSVKSGEEVFDGIAESVSPEGDLLLRQADGALFDIPAGDVTLRV